MADNVRFAGIRRVLEGAGYSLGRINGSHHVFTREGQRPFSVPVHHGQVKAVYLWLAKKLADEEDE